MTEEIKIFKYNDEEVVFGLKDGRVMIDATSMGRQFGESKAPKFWLQNQRTGEFLNELTKVRNLTLTDLVVVTQGGNNPGTWMDEDVFLEHARWLSPAFAIWCNDRIKELFRHWVKAMNPDDSVRSKTPLADLYELMYEEKLTPPVTL